MSQLIDQLVDEGVLKTPRIIDAFRAVPRRSFLMEGDRAHEDVNTPIPIGFGQTNSQPLTVAFMIELLCPQPGERVLDIGFGSGWTTALLAHLVGSSGSVVGIERIEDLYAFGKENLARAGITNTELHCGDGSKGRKDRAPYGCIHVGAAASDIPDALLEQMGVGGRMVIPVGVATQYVVRVERTGENDYRRENYPGFSFVPLVEGTA